MIGARALLMREIPVQSPSSINAMFERIDTLSQDWDRFSYVVDLTEAKRPDAATRATLKERVRRITPASITSRSSSGTICSCAPWRGWSRMAWGWSA